MNTLQMTTIRAPSGKDDTSAMLVIDNVNNPFVFHDITEVGKEYTFSFYICSESDGEISINGDTLATTSDWTRYENTFTANSSNILIYFNVVGTYYIYNSQLEIGNQVTDYRPCPDDVEEKFTNYSTTSGVESMISVFKESILQSVSETYVTTTTYNGLSGQVTSLESWKESASLLLTKEGIIGTVGSYYTTIDDINVGSRNIALKTANVKTYTGTNSSNQGEILYYLSKNWTEFVGEYVTISFDYEFSEDAVRTDSETAKAAAVGMASSPWNRWVEIPNPSSGLSGHCSGTFFIPDTMTSSYGIGMRLDYFSGTLTISNLKFEKGNIETDWNQAPEDVDYRFTIAESRITQNTESIELRVEKNGVISAINQTSENITIDASKINLSGYVTMSNLATAGETVIDGANITTGSITADKIDVTDLFAQDITATGTITGVSLIGATGDFTGTVTATNLIATSTGKISIFDFDEYGFDVDFNGDGVLDYSFSKNYFVARIYNSSNEERAYLYMDTEDSISGINGRVVIYSNERIDLRFPTDGHLYIMNADTLLSVVTIDSNGIVQANKLTTVSHSDAWINALNGNAALYVSDAGLSNGFNALATIPDSSGGAWTMGVLNSSSSFYLAYGNASRLSSGTNGTDSSVSVDTAGILHLNNWLYTAGNVGWYNSTYGGGWYMEDDTWLRVYGGKSIYTSSGIIRSDNKMEIRNSSASHMVLVTSSREGHFQISSAGNLGIYDTTNTSWVIYSDNSANIYIGGKCIVPTSGASGVRSNGDNAYACGHTSYRWTYVYAASGVSTTSDEREKDILDLDLSEMSDYFMSLKPIAFRWNYGTDRKIRFGLGAQTSERKLSEAGYDPSLFAMIQHDDLEEVSATGLTERYGMNYQELQMLTMMQTQKTTREFASFVVDFTEWKGTVDTDLAILINANESLNEQVQDLREKLVKANQRIEELEEQIA